jgi:hypothetical protein
MIDKPADWLEPHPIVEAFLAIIQSGKRARCAEVPASPWLIAPS